MRSIPAFLIALAATGGSLFAQTCTLPSGWTTYYNSVDTTNATTLRATLHDLIDNHTVYPYTSGSTDTWDILEWADEDPSNSSRIVDIYLNESYAKQGGGNSFYNREHTWPSSYGFPDGAGTGPFTDCHSLRLVNDTLNSVRSNKPFDNCDAQCDEEPTQSTNGTGGGSGTFPGNSNWTEGLFTNGKWQCWAERKGDVARSIMYMAIRYEGDGGGEPDLILTDDRFLIASSNTGQDESVGYMGLLSVVLQWHCDDPPDAQECERNSRVAFYQGNRNPFVDHPEYADILWGSSCGGGGPTPGSFSRYGTGCPTSGLSTPVIAEITDPRIDSNLLFLASGGPPSQPGALHLGFAQSNINLGIIGYPACTMLAPPDLAFSVFASPVGIAFTIVNVPNDANLVGVALHGQFLFAEFAIPLISASGGGIFTLGSN